MPTRQQSPMPSSPLLQPLARREPAQPPSLFKHTDVAQGISQLGTQGDPLQQGEQQPTLRAPLSPPSKHTFLFFYKPPRVLGRNLPGVPTAGEHLLPWPAATPACPGSCSPELGGGRLYLKALDLPN